MTQKRNAERIAPQEDGVLELLEGLRRDIFKLLIETEGLVAFKAEKQKTRHALKSTGVPKPRRIDAHQQK